MSKQALNSDPQVRLACASEAAALLIDELRRVVWHNRQAEVLFGAPNLLGQPVRQWLGSVCGANDCASCPSRQANGPLIRHGARDDGSPLALELECSHLRDGEARRSLLLLREVSQRPEAAKASCDVRMLAQAVTQAGDAIAIASAAGIIEFVNPAFERDTGYSAGEAIGQTPNILNSGTHPSEFFSALWKTIRRGEVFREVFTNRRKNGDIYYEEKTITPIRDAGGEITHFVSTGRDVTTRVLAEARLDYLANYDVLTCLPNRSLFMDRLGQAIRHCQRDENGLTLFFVDLDRFKVINDTLGHKEGDLLLGKVAQRLCSAVCAEDTVARVGGDEFTVIVDSLRSPTGSSRVAEAIIAAFAAPFEINGRKLYVGVSIGSAIFPQDGEDVESLVKHADIAMFHAKASGRSTHVSFSAVMDGEMLEDLSMETALRGALANNEFSISYQPIVDPRNQCAVALEALLRWHSPQHGDVPPSRFIPMLEETNLIISVGRWVLANACRHVMAIEREDLAGVVLAVNLSGRQFRDPHLVSDVKKVLHDTGLAAHRLELEITESVLIEDATAAAKTLDALSSLGVRLAIDDFGTGYSSLSYLRRFPINTLKIDRSFVTELETSADAVVIVKAIINLAHSLGLDIVGEGVENAGQLALLAELGCVRVQGYWFSRPLPLHQLPVSWSPPVLAQGVLPGVGFARQGARPHASEAP